MEAQIRRIIKRRRKITMTNTTATKMAPVRTAHEMPLRDLQAFDPFRAIDRTLNRLFGNRSGWPEMDESFSLSTWAPTCDIYESGDEFVVKAELPEVKKEDVNVTFENNVFTLRGERKFDTAEHGEHFHRIESRYGEFLRSFTLPQQVDAGKINAEFKDGILRVRLPKRPEAKPKQIEIKLK
ncbi:MAG: Hsp20/alpha crystallin family protein [Blastocatellia bacterium]